MFRSTAESNYLSTFLSDEDPPLTVYQELVYVGHQIGTSSFFSTCFPNPPQPIRQVRFKNNFSKTSSVFWHSRLIATLFFDPNLGSGSPRSQRNPMLRTV